VVEKIPVVSTDDRVNSSRVINRESRPAVVVDPFA
jgi:hypothetical protein